MREPLALWAALLVIVALNLVLRGVLEGGFTGVRPYLLGRVDLDSVLRTAPWRLLLPLPELNEGAWGTTGFVLLFLAEKYFGAGSTYLAFNALLITTVFWTSWFALRSRIFCLTLAVCMAFTTFNYHVYSVPGSNVIYPHLIFLSVLMLTHYKVVESGRIRSGWGILSCVALVCYALSYEGWVAYVVFVLMAFPVVYVTMERSGRKAQARGVTAALAQTMAVALAYVVIRARMPTTFRFGTEADVIFNYKHLAPAVDDLISNFFTYFYLTISNLFPPSFGFSYALQRFGHFSDADVHRLVGDYHSAFQYLVYPHYLFMWRYYAGVAAAVFVLLLVRAVRSATRTGSLDALGVALFMLLTITTSPGHLLIKFRPYNTIPFLGYKTPSAVLGLYCLVAFLSMLAGRRFAEQKRLLYVGVGSLWGYIVYLGLTRPAVLTLISAQTQMGAYPDPAKALVTLLQGWLSVLR